MPPAAQLPHLMKLSIDKCPFKGPALPEHCRSIAAYVPQLTTLRLAPPSGTHWYTAYLWGPMFEILFSTTTTTLTQFTTSLDLSDKLVRLLCQQAPSLTKLGFYSVSGVLHDHSNTTWAVTQLTVSKAPPSRRADAQPVQPMVSMTNLARLPRSPAGLHVLPASGKVLSMCTGLISAQVGLYKPHFMHGF